VIADPPSKFGACHESETWPSPAVAERDEGDPGGPFPGGAPSIVTPKRCKTVSIGLPMVRPSPPAKRSATGWLPSWVTISDPESPAALKVPGEIEIWLTNRACWKQMSNTRR